MTNPTYSELRAHGPKWGMIFALAFLTPVARAELNWDADASANENNIVTGAGLGGSGTWGTSTNWFNGSGDVAWTAGSAAVFTGTSGKVTLASPQSASSLSFKATGFDVSGSTLTMGPSPATFNVDGGMTATISSMLDGAATMIKTGAGTLVLSNTANANTANTTGGGWRIDGGTLRINADQSLGAPLPAAARNTVTDIQINQSTLQFGGSFEVNINRRTKLNTNSPKQNLGDAVLDLNEHDVSWFGSIQGGLGTLRITDSNGHGGKLVLGTDRKACINPFGSALPGGTVNLTIENHVVVQTAGKVTPTGGELGSETGAGGAALAVKLQTGGQIRCESGGYTFQRNLILGPGGGSLDTGSWIQTWLGAISGVGSLDKFGASKLILDNTSATWAGGTHIHKGTLILSRGGSNGMLPGTLAAPSSVVIDKGATLQFSRGSDKTFFDKLSGEGNVTLSNGNNTVVRLVSNNTYTGLTTISSGILMIGQGNPNEPGSIVSNVLNNSILVFNRVEDLTYKGSISGSGVVNKEAAGKLTLTSASTCSGNTNVNAGTLIAANSSGSATGTGNVIVASGAGLGGNGNIAGAVTLNAGARLQPGTSCGNLTVGSLSLVANSILDYELAAPGAGDRTTISNSGALIISGGTVSITPRAGFAAGRHPLLNYNGLLIGSPLNLAIGAAPAGFDYELVNNPASSSIDLVVTPEP